MKTCDDRFEEQYKYNCAGECLPARLAARVEAESNCSSSWLIELDPPDPEPIDNE